MRRLAILALGNFGNATLSASSSSTVSCSVLLNGWGDNKSRNASNAHGPEMRMIATAVAPDPTDAPPPPEERANIVSSSSDVSSSADCWVSVADDTEEALRRVRYGYERMVGWRSTVDLECCKLCW